MNLTEMRQLLGSRNIQLTKSLGQNFLHDQNILRKIAAAGEVRPGDNVLEIGPGLGPLTDELLEAGARVLAIEKDSRLVEVLRGHYATNPKLELIQADALRYLEENPRDWTAWKLVANLPYSVASPILVELALSPQPPERLAVTLQLEVAQRLGAATDADDYGLLTLLVQVTYRVGEMFKIPASCFFPAPNVDSACITMHRRTIPLVDPDQLPLYRKLVKQSFSERRKMMMKLLKRIWPEDILQAAFAANNISLQERAEKVSVEQFAAFTRFIAAAGLK